MPRLFKCPYYNYSSDWKSNLSRHVREVHGNSSMADELAYLPLRTPRLDRYCAKCDIQFASYKNYQAHKEQYCSTGHVPESIDSSSSPTPTQQLQEQQPQNQEHHPIALPNQPRFPGSNTTTTTAVTSEYKSKAFNMVLKKTIIRCCLN
ncbi:hypothetical protein CDAR_399331 [Caerostris darwini]|uniref:ZFPM2-like C-terminal CCHC zinc finger domain-containing protein n=1 Tax=Caerostris darwini TaxID=1538125 RepID=A0AAV4SXH6_9ARAC|nr:hypothetical protein CDAR_399331 [Caerostris darwini]